MSKCAALRVSRSKVRTKQRAYIVYFSVFSNCRVELVKLLRTQIWRFHQKLCARLSATTFPQGLYAWKLMQNVFFGSISIEINHTQYICVLTIHWHHWGVHPTRWWLERDQKCALCRDYAIIHAFDAVSLSITQTCRLYAEMI